MVASEMDLDMAARELLADSLKSFGCYGLANRCRDGTDISVRTMAAICALKDLLRLG